MKNSIKIFVSILFVLLINSCAEENIHSSKNCEQQVIISAEEYKTAPNDFLNINNIEINGDCLLINFSSSGCSGDTWELKLIDANVIMKSNPPQRIIRLSLKNEELCEAYITKQISFDISKLQVYGNNVYLNITNSDKCILYEY